MKYVEVVAEATSTDTLIGIADKVKALDIRFFPVGDDGMRPCRMLVRDDHLQEALDITQSLLGAQMTARIVVLPVETILPKPDIEEEEV